MDLLEEQSNPDGGDRRRAAIFGTFAAIAIAIVAFFLLTDPVPDVTGLPLEAAEQELDTAGFDVGRTEEVPALSEDEVGMVVAQDPLDGLVWVWTRVDLTVAVEAETPVAQGDGEGEDLPGGAVVPREGGLVATSAPPGADRYYKEPIPAEPTSPRLLSVLDLPLAEAVAALDAADLGYTVSYGPSTTGVTEGHVFFQDPAPDTALDEVTTVELWVSTSPPSDGYPYPQPD